ncbi:MAG: hypothetical protein QOD30_2512 [Actinomycetota bacterium]|nr:hypothetical protein [Actinomycetota bacterium]
MIGRRAVVAAAIVAIATSSIGYAADASGGTDDALGPGLVTVTIDIDHSHFSIDHLRVHTGTLVRFLVDNHDPIAHELVVGDGAVHAAHEQGSEAIHPPVPGEVSVAGGDVGETFYRFDVAGSYLFACHLPRHFAYGMHGVVTVSD